MTGSKLVVLGGSSPNTVALLPALQQAAIAGVGEVSLVGRSAERVERMGRHCRDLAQRLNLDMCVSWDTDLSRAARDATYVLNVLRVGGQSTEVEDRRALAVSGVVGHAASYLEAMRHLPPTLQAAKTVEAVAPQAVFINFANPVSILCEAIATNSGLTVFGICKHAFALRGDFAQLLGVAPTRVRVQYLGLNHLGWVTDVQVDGESRFEALVDRLIAGRVKAYDYQLIRAFNAIPIKHAAALYRKGEVIYVRQHGVRASLTDVAIRYSATAWVLPWLMHRERRREPGGGAGWYASCVAPFLKALDSGVPCEHIVTWQTGGAVPQVSGATAETSAIIEGSRVSPTPVLRGLPDVAVEWVRQVRASERHLIRAVLERSLPALVEALAIHPNVASVAHAQDFVRRHGAAAIDHV